MPSKGPGFLMVDNEKQSTETSTSDNRYEDDSTKLRETILSSETPKRDLKLNKGLFHFLHKRRFWFVIVVVIVLATTIGIFLFINTKNNDAKKNKAKLQTTVIDGKTYTVDPLFNDTSPKYTPSPASDYEKQIQEIEAKNNQKPTYSNYFVLGVLYGNMNNKQQAIDNYNKAKSYVPKDNFYQSSIDELNRRIRLLEVSK